MGSWIIRGIIEAIRGMGKMGSANRPKGTGL